MGRQQSSPTNAPPKKRTKLNNEATYSKLWQLAIQLIRPYLKRKATPRLEDSKSAQPPLTPPNKKKKFSNKNIKLASKQSNLDQLLQALQLITAHEQISTILEKQKTQQVGYEPPEKKPPPCIRRSKQLDPSLLLSLAAYLSLDSGQIGFAPAQVTSTIQSIKTEERQITKIFQAHNFYQEQKSRKSTSIERRKTLVYMALINACQCNIPYISDQTITAVYLTMLKGRQQLSISIARITNLPTVLGPLVADYYCNFFIGNNTEEKAAQKPAPLQATLSESISPQTK